MEASDTTSESLPFEVSPAEAAELIENGAQLIDVRQDYEFDAAHLAGAKQIGLQEVAERRGEIDKDNKVLFYCRVGNRSAMAAQAFQEAGFDVSSLAGGIAAWIDAGQTIEPADGYVAEPGQAAAILESRSRAESK